MITRKLGSILRGKATPFQLVSACVLGALLGFAPGLTQGPALWALLIAALLVVNANLGLALLVAGASKLLSLALLPVSFSLGRFLLDGPTAGLARALINAPILAWCGFEYYVVAGGQLLGLLLGLGAGLGLAATVSRFRRRMAAAQGQSSRLGDLAAKPGARFLIWLLFGGAAKGSWEDKLAKRVGNPVRVWGAALIVLALVGAFLGQRALAGPLARRGLIAGLELANGATVDVGAVELQLGEGRLSVAELALADPSALDTDLFRAALLEADVDQADFLRRKLHVASIVVRDAQSGAPRSVPGVRTAPPVEEAEPEEAPAEPGDYRLEDVLADYSLWKERLTQARRWLDRLAARPSGAEPEETLEQRLKREARELGLRSVKDRDVVEQAPTLRLSELVVDGLRTAYLPQHTFDLHASELSTQPRLLDAPPRLELSSRDGAISMAVDLAPASRAGGPGALRFAWKGLAIDEALGQLRLGGPAPFQGGTLDLELDGAWGAGGIGFVDLPLRVTLHDTTFSLKGMQPTRLDQLVLPIGLSGPIDRPRIHFDASALSDALLAAGKKELARQVQEKLQGQLGEKLGELGERAGVELPEDLGDLKELGEKLPGGLEEKLPDASGTKDALKGLLGGKKKKD